MRHAQTDDNLVKRYTGRSDNVGINKEGKKQLKAVVPFLKSKKIKLIFSSPFKRCLETSLLLGKYLGLKGTIEEDLKEVNYGKWQGLTSIEVQERFPEIFKARGKDPVHVAPPEGETLLNMQKRVIEVIKKIISTKKNCLVVTHGSCIHAILMYFKGINLKKFWDFSQEYKLANCSISELLVLKKSVRVEKIGWIPEVEEKK